MGIFDGFSTDDIMEGVECLTPWGLVRCTGLGEAARNSAESAKEVAGEIADAAVSPIVSAGAAAQRAASNVNTTISTIGNRAVELADRNMDRYVSVTRWGTIAIYGVVILAIIGAIFWFFGRHGGPVGMGVS